MTSSRRSWATAGLVTGLAGLATSYLTASILNVRDAPVVAVGELVIRITPGNLAERAIGLVGQWDKPLLITGIVLGSIVVFVAAGLLGRRHVWLGTLAFTVLGAVAVAAVLTNPVDTQSGLIPVVVGYATWLVAFGWLSAMLRRPARAGVPSEPTADPISRRALLDPRRCRDAGRHRRRRGRPGLGGGCPQGRAGAQADPPRRRLDAQDPQAAPGSALPGVTAVADAR